MVEIVSLSRKYVRAEVLGIREEADLIVALAGAMNTGKSSLFNILTGASTKVSNWPGTTVSVKRGYRRSHGKTILFIDLPGIRGYYGATLEESVAKKYLLHEKYDFIVALGDYVTPEKSLYINLLIAELFPRTIFVFNKVDKISIKEAKDFENYLYNRLGVKIISISAIRETGVKELEKTILELGSDKRSLYCTNIGIDYGDLEQYIEDIIKILSNYHIDQCRTSLRGLAVNYLAEDFDVENYLNNLLSETDMNRIASIRERARENLKMNLADYIITKRYEFIESLLKSSPLKKIFETTYYRKGWIDRIIEIPLGGVLIALGILFLLFSAIFILNTGFPLTTIFSMLGLEEISTILETYSLSGLLSALIGFVTDLIRSSLTNAPEPLVSLLTDGILGGVGAVLTFVPLIFLVSLGFAVLEDSGVATRVAVGLHRGLSRFGFSGRYVYPILVALGCNVPAVMLSRGALSSGERLAQILSVPFIPCQARLIVMLAFAQAIFPDRPLEQVLLVLLIYVIGITISIISGAVTRRLFIHERYEPELLLELPEVHRPYAKVVGWISWSYTKEFIIKAGIIIFLLSIFVWFLSYYGPGGYVGNKFEESYGYLIGSYIAPLLSPLNIDPQKAPYIGFALLQGFVAKEGLLSGITIMTGIENPVEAVESLGLTTVQMISLLIFLMLYVPCLATLSVIYQETRSIKWTLLAIFYMISIALLISLAVYYTLSLM